jgi:ABC-type transport system involved in multi-copper enzyme maturation permease subunit
MSGFGAMVWNGFREARRNRVTVVVAAFAVAVLSSSILVAEVTVNTFGRVLSDFGLGAMSLILVFLSIFLSCGLLSREIERRTIFLVVSRPISRTQFLVARLCGNLLTLLVLEVAMFLLFWGMLALYREPLTLTHVAAAAGLWVELAVLSAAGFFFSSFASQMTSAVATTGLYMAGHLAETIYGLAQRSESGALRLVGKSVFYAIPQLERLNFRPYATYQLPVPLDRFLAAAGYGLAYTVLLCALASFFFQRRDFK